LRLQILIINCTFLQKTLTEQGGFGDGSSSSDAEHAVLQRAVETRPESPRARQTPNRRLWPKCCPRTPLAKGPLR
jgi:hypothetical protein